MLIKNDKPMMAPAGAVKVLRAAGWKSVKEWEDVEAKRARKAIKGMTEEDARKHLTELYWRGRALGAYAGAAPTVSLEDHLEEIKMK